jgi:hypothetical protein
MTEDQFNQAVDSGNVKQVQQDTPAQTTPDQQPQFSQQPGFDETDPLISALRRPRPSLTALPTFTPKTFADSIQWVDDGIKKRPVFYINGQWVDLAPDIFSSFTDLIHWNSIDGFNTYNSGTGAVAANDSSIEIDTAIVLNGFQGIASKNPYIDLVQTGKQITVEWIIFNILSAIDTHIRLYISTDSGAVTDSHSHFGFKLVGDATGIKVFGSTGDASAELATLLDSYSLVLSGNQFTRLKVVFTPGTKADFYINGTLLGTNVNSLPSASNMLLNCSISKDDNDNSQRSVTLGRVLIQKTY